MDTGPLHAETNEMHPQSQTCAVTGMVYTFLPKGPGPPALLCLTAPVCRSTSTGPRPGLLGPRLLYPGRTQPAFRFPSAA